MLERMENDNNSALKKVLEHVTLSYNIEANGIRHCIATAGLPVNKSNKRTLVMLLHGWPESWYSWRHQLIFLKNAGYAVCAPDMRGYGNTDAPKELSSYSIDVLVQDVMAIADNCLLQPLSLDNNNNNNNNSNIKKFIVVGHDFGAYLAWHVALRHPESILGVCGMSVPYMGHPSQPPLQRYRQIYHHNNDYYNPEAHFHYMLYHCLPNAHLEYQKNIYETFYRLFGEAQRFQTTKTTQPTTTTTNNNVIQKGTPEVTDKHMFVLPRPPPSFNNNNYYYKNNKGDNSKDEDGGSRGVPWWWDARYAPGLWKRLPRLKQLPSWLSSEDLDYFVSQYKLSSSSFEGGLKWYQALDDHWYQTKNHPKIIQVPALLLAGMEDNVIRFHGGPKRIQQAMHRHSQKRIQCIFSPNAGHWIQQEIPHTINQHLLTFLQSLPTTTINNSNNNNNNNNNHLSRL